MILICCILSRRLKFSVQEIWQVAVRLIYTWCGPLHSEGLLIEALLGGVCMYVRRLNFKTIHVAISDG